MTSGDIGTPNPNYFSHVDQMLRLAGEHGMVMFLDVVETVGWLDLFRSSGLVKAEAYGHYLGTRYRNFPNIIWMYGNDFQTWATAYDDQVVLAVARGIAATDPNHLNTTELNYYDSASLDDPTWHSIIQLNGVYTYHPTYAKLLPEYNRLNFRPCSWRRPVMSSNIIRIRPVAPRRICDDKNIGPCCRGRPGSFTVAVIRGPSQPAGSKSRYPGDPAICLYDGIV